MKSIKIKLYFFIEKKGKDGWSSYIKNEEGIVILNSSEQTNLEKMFKRAPWLLTFLTDGKSQESQELLSQN